MPEVTVIVPAFNCESEINKCILSVLNQSLQDFELIIVNDGSTDNTEEAVKPFLLDNRVILINKTNGGVSSARNCALDIAQGKYILMIDADDWVESNFLELLFEKAESEDADIVFCGYYIDFIESNNSVKKFFDIPKASVLEQIRYIESLNNMNIIWNKIYKREIINKHHIRFSTDLLRGEDLYFNNQYFRYVKNIESIHNFLYHYIRKNNSSLLQIFIPDMFFQQKKIFSSKKKFLKIIGLSDESDNRLLNNHYYNMINNCIKNEFRKKQPFLVRKQNILIILSDEEIKERFSDKSCYRGINKLLIFLYYNHYSFMTTSFYTILFFLKRIMKPFLYKRQIQSANN